VPDRERLLVARCAEEIDASRNVGGERAEPMWAKRTVSPLAPTVHTNGVLVVNDLMPSPLVLMTAVKLPPTLAPAGRFVILGVLGTAPLTVNVCGLPSACG
jgi:hypothetical protein